MPEFKETNIEWLGTIPEHWSTAKIKQQFRVIPSNVDKKTNDDEIEVKLCNYVDVYYNDEISKGLDFMSATATELEIDKFQLQLGDVLITKDSEDPLDIAVPAYINHTEPKLLCGYHLSMLRTVNNKIDGKFLFWSLADQAIASQLYREATGVTRWAIASRHIKNSSIAYPPLDEQKAIADYLDKATAKIDRVIKIKEEQLEKIREMRKSTVNHVTQFGLKKNYKTVELGIEYLPKINSKWSTDRFKDVASLRTEKTDQKSEELNYLELEDLSQGTGEILNLRNTLEVESKTTKFYKGDVLFGKLRPYLEKYAQADFNGLCTGEILAFEPTKIHGKFLMFIISSRWFINLCNSMSYGAKMPRVNWATQLSRIELPLPSKEEQNEIVEYLENLMNKDVKLTEKLENQIDTLIAYRKSLIHECVTGKKQVAEPVPH